jgi:PAS domain S-box-containing protein
MSSHTKRVGSESDRVLAAALDGVMTIDADGRVVELNPAAEEIFGYSRAKALGRPLAELVIPPEHRAAHRAGLERAVAEGQSWVLGRRVELTAMRADGREFPVEVSVSRTPHDPPRFTGWIRDLSERDAERRQADREVAAHLAVSKALTAGGSLEEVGERLLRDLATALDFAVAALWVPSGAVLEPRLFCSAASVKAPEYERATRELRLPVGIGLPGLAWQRQEPIDTADLRGDTNAVRREAAARDGLSCGVAIPAVAEKEVLAVAELCSKHEAELTDRLRRLLTGVGYELGAFLGRRRGELHPPPLTPRQLQVLELAADGLAGPEIAERLVIAPATVKTHFEHIYSKLRVSGRGEAVARGLRDGLIQ